MALGTKGMALRLSNSTDLVTIQSSVLTISKRTTVAPAKFLSSDTVIVDFVDLGYTTGMRMQTNSSNNTSIYTAQAVNADVISLKASSDITEDDASTTLSFTGYSMEEIGEIVSIDGPSGSVPIIDITHLGSTARAKLVGIQDEGQVTMEVLAHFTTGLAGVNQWKLQDIRQTGTKGFFDLIFTDETGTTAEPSAYFFEGFVTGYSPGAALDDAVKTAITLEITGQSHFINAISS